MALLALLKQPREALDTASLAAVCSAAKKVAANEDICKELADAGTVNVTMQVRTADYTENNQRKPEPCCEKWSR